MNDLTIGVIIGTSLAASVGSVISGLNNSIDALKEKASNIQIKLDAGRAFQDSRSDLEAALADIGTMGVDAWQERSGKTIQQLTQQLDDARSSASGLGLNTDNIDSQIDLIGRAGDLAEEQIGRVEACAERSDIMDNLLGQILENVGILSVPISLAVDYEDAMADVKKVVDFSSDAEFDAMKKNVLALSSQIALSAGDLGKIMSAFGQAGVAKEELLSYTEAAAKMGVAFDMSAESAGNALSGLKSIFGGAIDDVTLLGDAINSLSNGMNSSAPDILNVLNRTGSMGKQFGLTGQQISALASTFLDLQTPPEVAATAINALLLKLATAPVQSDAFVCALGKLGYTAEGIQEAIGKDAQGTLEGFLETLKKVPDSLTVTATLFGAEYSDDIVKLVDNLDKYKAALAIVDNPATYSGAMEAEFQTRAATTANSLQLLLTHVVRLGTTIGSVLLPPFNTLLSAISSGAASIAAFADAHPALTSNITLAAGAIIGLNTALLAAKLGWLGMMNAGSSVIGIVQAIRPSSIQAALALRGISDSGSLLTKVSAGFSAMKAGLAADIAVMQGALISLGSGIKTAALSMLSFAQATAASAAVAVKSLGVACLGAVRQLGAMALSAGSSAVNALLGLGASIGSKVIPAITGFNAVLLANPVVAITAGIIALGSAIYLLVTYWDQVKAAFSSAISYIGSKITEFKTWIGEIIAPFAAIPAQIGEALAGVTDAIIAPFAAAFDWLAGKFAWLSDTWQSITGTLSGGTTPPDPNAPSGGVLGINTGALLSAKDAGASIPDQIALGITDNSPKTETAMDKMTAAMDKYNCHSPAQSGSLARITEAGPGLVSMLARGIIDTSPQAIGAMAGLAQNIGDTLPSELTMPALTSTSSIPNIPSITAIPATSSTETNIMDGMTFPSDLNAISPTSIISKFPKFPELSKLSRFPNMPPAISPLAALSTIPPSAYPSATDNISNIPSTLSSPNASPPNISVTMGDIHINVTAGSSNPQDIASATMRMFETQMKEIARRTFTDDAFLG